MKKLIVILAAMAMLFVGVGAADATETAETSAVAELCQAEIWSWTDLCMSLEVEVETSSTDSTVPAACDEARFADTAACTGETITFSASAGNGVVTNTCATLRDKWPGVYAQSCTVRSANGTFDHTGQVIPQGEFPIGLIH